MDKPEALFLADELEAPLGTVIGAELYRRAAEELRRLHAENAVLHDRHHDGNVILTQMLAQRDALLEVLKQSLEEAIYPSKQLSDVYEKASAAIKAVEETK